MTTSTMIAATTVDQRFAGQRPRNHPAMANIRKLPSSDHKRPAPYALINDHASQITVIKIGTETACRSTSIHTPGLGRTRVHAGCSVSAT